MIGLALLGFLIGSVCCQSTQEFSKITLDLNITDYNVRFLHIEHTI
jgi:hypothetical protein